jgi:hypothetical protein
LRSVDRKAKQKVPPAYSHAEEARAHETAVGMTFFKGFTWVRRAVSAVSREPEPRAEPLAAEPLNERWAVD